MKRLSEETGQSLVEYALLMAVLGIVFVTGLALLGLSVGPLLNEVRDMLSTGVAP